MLWFLCFAAVITVFYPYIRFLFKRISLCCRIKQSCRRANFQLHVTRRLWWLGQRSRQNCDFYVETPTQIISVKLFNMLRRRDVLVFTRDNKWFIRSYVALMTNIGTALMLPLEKRKHNLCAYNFRYRFVADWEIKTPRRVLLIHPTCIEVRRQPRHGPEVIVGAGDVVSGMEIYSSSRFLGMMEVLF